MQDTVEQHPLRRSVLLRGSGNTDECATISLERRRATTRARKQPVLRRSESGPRPLGVYRSANGSIANASERLRETLANSIAVGAFVNLDNDVPRLE